MENTWDCKDSNREYMVEGWSDGYFSINKKSGSFQVNPFADKRTIQLTDIIDDLQNKGIQFPTVIRFHDILISRVKHLFNCYIKEMEKLDYRGHYLGAYPIKVNQMQEVVEEILGAGEKFFLGLEAGSKAELLAVLQFKTPKQSITILNGYKDEEYIKLALLGTMMGKQMIIVVEKFSELERIVNLAKHSQVIPKIGIRTKLTTQGAGQWADSTGENAKFGLSLDEILQAKKLLLENDMLEALVLLHFHIGSQVSNIQTLKDATSEATRIYTELVKEGYPLEYLDIGGGMGVNYEGSMGMSSTSVNYSAEDYISNLLYTVKEICDEEDVEHPHIISESGRYLTAHHSCIITQVVDSSLYKSDKLPPNLPMKNDTIKEMTEVFNNLNDDNFQQSYYQAVDLRNDSNNEFRSGKISLIEKAQIHQVFERLIEKIRNMKLETTMYENFMYQLNEAHYDQYICNLSMFQSVPDVWGIGQILPIVPITRLNEQPTREVRLVDITCDSDGKIPFYSSPSGPKKTVLLHRLEKGENYYLGIFMTGAYQDIMGDQHNLFGRLNEIHVYYDSDDKQKFYIEEHIRGHSTGKVLSTLQYNPETMARTVKEMIDLQIKRGKIKPRDGVDLIDFYENCLESYTYLS